MDSGCGSLVKLWSDADQSLMIRTLQLIGRHQHGNSTAGHPQSSLAPLRWQAVAAALTGTSGQSTKTNKAASDATIEASIVMSFTHVLNGVAGRLFRTFDMIIAVLRCLSDCVVAYYAQSCVNIAVNWVCAWQAVHTILCDLWAS